MTGDEQLSPETVAENPDGKIWMAGLSGILWALQGKAEKAYVSFLEAAVRVDHQYGLEID